MTNSEKQAMSKLLSIIAEAQFIVLGFVACEARSERKTVTALNDLLESPTPAGPP